MALDGSRAQFYRVRAAQVRDTADTCKNLDIKEQLENVAKEYERLAESVEHGILSR
jgi:hypothetical protein